jgi:ATP-dependent Clp protease adaptor protein ClpS
MIPILSQNWAFSVSPEIDITLEQQRLATEGPLYQVIIHNDNVTPMDFVLHILISVFFLAGPHALQIMYTAHFHGSAYVQTLPKPEAQKRVGLAHFSARLSGYPLEFSILPESGNHP